MLMNRVRRVRKHCNRIYVMMFDEDGDDTYPHSLVACPPHIRNRKQALAAIDKIYNEVTAKYTDEDGTETWNFADVDKALRRADFITIDPAFWVEQDARCPGPKNS